MSLTSSPITILVVDDDALITLNTADLLTEIGYAPLEAYSGREALELLSSRPDISAMMSDFSMPGMNGAELAHAARQLRPGLPILLVTGYAELPDNPECDLKRLEKPYSLEDLDKAIKQILPDQVQPV